MSERARAEEELATSAVLDAIDAGQWDIVRLMLHPYLHWTSATGETVRGRTQVLAFLQAGPPPPRPTSVELRDDQIYRWIT